MFVFKQRPEYERRISDWSSDVCSSDLVRVYSGSHVRPGQPRPRLALIVTWAMVHGGLVMFRDVPVFGSGLIDPDSYMRMVRVSELAQGWQWFDDTIARANAPYGDVLHWTRPFDLQIGRASCRERVCQYV